MLSPPSIARNRTIVSHCIKSHDLAMRSNSSEDTSFFVAGGVVLGHPRLDRNLTLCNPWHARLWPIVSAIEPCLGVRFLLQCGRSVYVYLN